MTINLDADLIREFIILLVLLNLVRLSQFYRSILLLILSFTTILQHIHGLLYNKDMLTYIYIRIGSFILMCLGYYLDDIFVSAAGTYSSICHNAHFLWNNAAFKNVNEEVRKVAVAVIVFLFLFPFQRFVRGLFNVKKYNNDVELQERND